MRILLSVILCLLFTVNVRAQSPQSEVKAANDFLVTVQTDAQAYIRFFSVYNVPDKDSLYISDGGEKLEATPAKIAIGKVLNFWIHSLSYEDILAPIKVTPTSPTLYWVDIRDYGWTPESWEKISEQDPYFREPWVNYEDYQVLRILSGNAIVRADWFIVHTSDVTKQADLGKTPLYYELLYSTIGIPKTLDEFRAKWGVDVKKIEALGIEKGVLVDSGRSGIARNNRQIGRTRTELGYYYETSDVKTDDGKRDYIENLDPFGLSRGDRDAGETFTTNKLGLQVYFLFDAQNKRVEFGDPTVVWDRKDPKDVRVRTARSCIICHAEAINIPHNALEEHLIDGVELVTATNEYKRAVESFYLTPMGKLYKADQEIYSDAVARTNGLSASENAELYKVFLEWYERNLSIEHAALECGVTVEEFKLKLAGTASGRLGALVVSERSIPRDTWESLEGGSFAQAMLHIHKLEISPPKPPENPLAPLDNPPEVSYNEDREVIKTVNVMSGPNKVGVLSIGDKVKILGEKDGWLKININGQDGFIKPEVLR